ncbi:GNAT family acetyltransferase [Paenibacillus xerothermodurans]|uniref:GNAT family acetyltransferase n=2 Tax=Paenibacillus xerothermodurans TaxID=1977292 RepID=A0A2W1N7X7_PAEXE|nr:GNAT family acetyltransferase [Paenibacillus xerothermodurans]
MLHEWNATGEILVPFTLGLDPSDFPAMLKLLEGYRTGNQIPDGYVPHSTFWLVNADRRVLGAVNIRHRLNDNLRQIGGHIGYGIRPSERRKGHATELLRLALIEARNIGIERALVHCRKTNVGSARVIQKNGGVLESEETDTAGQVVQRYWIEMVPR